MAKLSNILYLLMLKIILIPMAWINDGWDAAVDINKELDKCIKEVLEG
jgi:hypothetical protein